MCYENVRLGEKVVVLLRFLTSKTIMEVKRERSSNFLFVFFCSQNLIKLVNSHQTCKSMRVWPSLSKPTMKMSLVASLWVDSWVWQPCSSVQPFKRYVMIGMKTNIMTIQPWRNYNLQIFLPSWSKLIYGKKPLHRYSL